jgi:hypothetical protein
MLRLVPDCLRPGLRSTMRCVKFGVRYGMSGGSFFRRRSQLLPRGLLPFDRFDPL